MTLKERFAISTGKRLTIVHVTHDYREAISLAKRVGVIHNRGILYRRGTPEYVFSRPVNKFVARYAGIRNFFRVKFFSEDGRWKAKCDGTLVFILSGNHYPDEGLMILRSDAIKIHNGEPLNKYENCFRGHVREVNSSEYGMEIMVDAGEMFYVDVSVDDLRI